MTTTRGNSPPRKLAHLAADPVAVPDGLAARAATTALATPRATPAPSLEDIVARLGLRLAATAALAAMVTWSVSGRALPVAVESSSSSVATRVIPTSESASPMDAWLGWTSRAQDLAEDTTTRWKVR